MRCFHVAFIHPVFIIFSALLLSKTSVCKDKPISTILEDCFKSLLQNKRFSSGPIQIFIASNHVPEFLPDLNKTGLNLFPFRRPDEIDAITVADIVARNVQVSLSISNEPLLLQSHEATTMAIKDLIMIIDSNDLTTIINATRSGTGVNLLLVMIRKNSPDSSLSEIYLPLFQHFQAVNVLSPVVLELSLADGDLVGIQLVSWLPYSSYRICRSVSSSVLLSDKWDSEEGRFKNNGYFLRYRVDRNLHGCNIRASIYNISPFVSEIHVKGGSTTQYGGYEVFFFRLMASVLNFTAVIVSTESPLERWGELRPDGVWSGTVGRLLLGKADVTFGGQRATENTLRVADVSSSYLRDSLTWFSPAPARIPGWKNLMVVFTPVVWLDLALCFITVNFVIWALANRKRVGDTVEDRNYRHPAKLITNVLLVQLSFSVPEKPRTLPVKIVYVAWFLYTFQMSTLYQSYLMSVLADPGYDDKITDEASLIESGMPCGSVHLLQRIYQAIADPSRSPRITTLCTYMDTCVQQMAYNRNLSVFGTRQHLSYIGFLRYRDKRGKSLFFPFDEDTISYNVEMFLRKGSPLLEIFNTAILRITQSGLMVNYVNKLREEFWLETNGMGIEDDTDDWKNELDEVFVISPFHLQGAFFLYVVGIAFSVMAFLSEFFYHGLDICVGRSLKRKLRYLRDIILVKQSKQNQKTFLTKNRPHPIKPPTPVLSESSNSSYLPQSLQISMFRKELDTLKLSSVSDDNYRDASATSDARNQEDR